MHGEHLTPPSMVHQLAQRLILDAPLWRDAPQHLCLKVGRYLTQLGDMRPGVLSLMPEWCQIGINDGPSAVTDACSMPSMAKYHVTNQQWRYFMDDAGYTTPCWWGNAWDVRVHYGWVEPYGWPESYNQPNLPVTGISWYEACAYCRWLMNNGHSAGWLSAAEEIRPPTLAEWQQATYGATQRQYPWGNRWHPDLVNTIESGIHAPTPVGCFLASINPTGICDLIGNVSEWCSYRSNQIVRVGGSYSETIEQAHQVDGCIDAYERRQIFGLRLVKAQRKSRMC
jgi:formylglycine-generating enzyme required for sulfatase activity